MKSHKDNEKNLNNVLVQIGIRSISKDILDFVVYSDDAKEFKISDLLDKILIQETEIQNLKKIISDNKIITDSNNSLTINAVDILSQKLSTVEIDLEELKEKIKSL